MNLRPLLPLALCLASACAYPDDAPPLPDQPRGERAERQLQAMLAGKTPGPPRACITGWEARRMTVIDDDTLLFRVNRDLVYRNDPGGCRGLGMGRALVLRRIGTGLCRGDIGRVVDQQTGIETGACPLNDFIPYRSGPARQ